MSNENVKAEASGQEREAQLAISESEDGLKRLHGFLYSGSILSSPKEDSTVSEPMHVSELARRMYFAR